MCGSSDGIQKGMTGILYEIAKCHAVSEVKRYL